LIQPWLAVQDNGPLKCYLRLGNPHAVPAEVLTSFWWHHKKGSHT